MYNLRKCRIACGFNQKYVAIEVGVKPPTVSQWESGAKKPTIDNCIKLADVYHVTLDRLVGRTPVETELTGDSLTEQEAILVSSFRKFNGQGKEFLLQTLATMEASNIYKKRDNLPVVEAE